jgi:hypothetical protein
VNYSMFVVLHQRGKRGQDSMKDLAGRNYINIDVMSRVHGGITTKPIASRAVLAESPAGPFLVMHPLDVLQGRLENVYALSAKQDEHTQTRSRG